MSPDVQAELAALKQKLEALSLIAYNHKHQSFDWTKPLPGGGGHIIQEEGTSLANRLKLNFVGATVTATDDAANNQTDITITSGSAKTATLIVGPSANSDSTGYDYVTDGTDDDVQIQAAIDALPTNGGSICLREGTYTLGSAAVTIAKNGVEIFGVGKGTIVTCKNFFNLSLFKLGHASTQYTNCVLRDIYFDGNQTNQGTTSYIIDNKTLTKFITNVVISGCYFVNARDAALYDTSPTTLIDGNYFSNWATCALSLFDGTYITNSFFSNTSTSAAYITSNTQTPIVIGCIFRLPANYNATMVAILQTFANNTVLMSSGSISSSAIVVNSTDLVYGNYISCGSGHASSIGIGAIRRTVSNNYINGVGTAIVASIDASVVISGNSILAQGHGILVSATSSVSSTLVISGNYIVASRDTNNTYDCINLAGSALRSIIVGNSLVQGTTGNRARYGVNETTNSCGPNVINGNMILGTQTAALVIAVVATDASHNITS